MNEEQRLIEQRRTDESFYFNPKECWKTKESRSKRGKFYSINLEKGESQWGAPLSNDDAVGWEKNISNTNKRIYYRNIKTRDCQWDKPKPKEEPLKQNWEERRSQQCNQVYYINTKDNLSQWERPNEIVTKLKSSLKEDTSQIDLRELNEKKAREEEKRQIALRELIERDARKEEKRQKDLRELFERDARKEEERQKDLRELNERKAKEEDERQIALKELFERKAREQEQIKKKSDEDEMWPMGKMRKMLNYMVAQPDKRKYAVVVTTGAMNPVHKGHIDLIDQAKLRLWYAGYKVIGAWLSPSHDFYLQPKAFVAKTIGLSAEFRVEVTKRTVAKDPLIDVGLWESSQLGFEDFPNVCLSLKKRIENAKIDFEITVFYACGTDHAKNMNLYNRRHEWGGVVVVPRKGQEVGIENPDFKVYVAQPGKEDISSISSTLIREAIAANKPEIVRKMMTGDAAEFLLNPTNEEKKKFSDDFDKLKKSKAPF